MPLNPEESSPHKLASYQAIECHLTILEGLQYCFSSSKPSSLSSRCRFAAAAAGFQFTCVIDDRRIFLKTVLDEVIAQRDQFFFVLLERNGQFGVPHQRMGYLNESKMRTCRWFFLLSSELFLIERESINICIINSHTSDDLTAEHFPPKANIKQHVSNCQKELRPISISLD